MWEQVDHGYVAVLHERVYHFGTAWMSLVQLRVFALLPGAAYGLSHAQQL